MLLLCHWILVGWYPHDPELYLVFLCQLWFLKPRKPILRALLHYHALDPIPCHHMSWPWTSSVAPTMLPPTYSWQFCQGILFSRPPIQSPVAIHCLISQFHLAPHPTHHGHKHISSKSSHQFSYTHSNLVKAWRVPTKNNESPGEVSREVDEAEDWAKRANEVFRSMMCDPKAGAMVVWPTKQATIGLSQWYPNNQKEFLLQNLYNWLNLTLGKAPCLAMSCTSWWEINLKIP